MAKSKNLMLEALKARQSYSWTQPQGGDLASMRAAIKHGQTITLSPVSDPSAILVGDIVLVQWQQGYILHLVGEIRGEQYLIVNSVGKVNGWVSSHAILGRVTQIIDPEPRPSVPTMLEHLEAAYHMVITQNDLNEADAQRLLAICENLHWYADRISVEQWGTTPRSNKWSFEQQLWRLVQQTQQAITIVPSKPASFYVGSGHECVGFVAEITRLLEPTEAR